MIVKTDVFFKTCPFLCCNRDAVWYNNCRSGYYTNFIPIFSPAFPGTEKCSYIIPFREVDIYGNGIMSAGGKK